MAYAADVSACKMSNMTGSQKVGPTRHQVGPGGFRVQYTNSAQEQLSRLNSETFADIQKKLRVIAAVDPYAHGRADPGTGHRDIRVVGIDQTLVSFWVSHPVKTLTVVNVKEGNDVAAAWPQPYPAQTTPAFGTPRPLQIKGFDDDEAAPYTTAQQ